MAVWYQPGMSGGSRWGGEVQRRSSPKTFSLSDSSRLCLVTMAPFEGPRVLSPSLLRFLPRIPADPQSISTYAKQQNTLAHYNCLPIHAHSFNVKQYSLQADFHAMI